MPAARRRASRAVVERDFYEAIERIRANRPRDPKLKRLAAEGRLSLNVSTVAQEAKRARTLIGYDSCQYQDVRKRILESMKPGAVAAPRTASEVISRLRAEVSRLNESLRASMDAQVAHLVARQKAEREAERWRAEAIRRGDEVKALGKVSVLRRADA